MRIKEKPSRMFFLALDVVILVLITYVCLVPIWHMIMASLSNPTALNVHTSMVYYPLKNVDFQAYLDRCCQKTRLIVCCAFLLVTK